MLTGKKVLVLGLAKSGMAATRLLCHLHAQVVVNESKTLEELQEKEELESLGVQIVAGGQPDELFERDFDFVVKNPGIKYTQPFILRLQERKIPIYTEIELAYQVCQPQHYIAITGTNGKTTTTSLVYEIIKKRHSNTFVAGNIGIPLCEVALKENLIENEGNYIVLEMSNFQLLNIDKFKPEIATIINLTPDHLDYMRNLDEYYASKMKIYQNQTEEDFFILNIDDQNILEYTKKYPIKATQIPFSMEKNTTACIKDEMIIYDNEPVFDLHQLLMVGKHNVQNVMIALMIAKCLDIPISTIQSVLAHFKGVEHRIEFVRELDGVKYYNDSKATNVDSTIVAINSFKQPLIILLGGFDKGLDLSALKTLLVNAKAIICFGKAGKRFARDLQSPYYENNLEAAILKAHQLSKAGDVVLLSPSTSSFDEFSGYEQRGKVFKDIVNHL